MFVKEFTKPRPKFRPPAIPTAWDPDGEEEKQREATAPLQKPRPVPIVPLRSQPYQEVAADGWTSRSGAQAFKTPIFGELPQVKTYSSQGKPVLPYIPQTSGSPQPVNPQPAPAVTDWSRMADETVEVPIYRYINNLGTARTDYRKEQDEIRIFGTGNADGAWYIYNSMTDDEVGEYNRIFHEDSQAASDAYLEALLPVLNERLQKNVFDEYVELTQEHPIFMSLVGTIPKHLRGTAQLDIWGQRLGNWLEGEPDKPLDFGSRGMTNYTIDQAISQTANEALRDKYGVVAIDEEKYPFWAKLLNGRSLADANQAISNMLSFNLSRLYPGGSLLMGLGSGTDAMMQIKAQGGTDDQALKMGLANTGISAMTAAFSKGRLGQSGDIQTAAEAGKFILEQGGARAVEGLLSKAAKDAADRWIMEENSQYEQLVRQYMGEGLPEEDARAAAAEDYERAYLFGMVTDGLSGSATAALSVPWGQVYGKDRGLPPWEDARLWERQMGQQDPMLPKWDQSLWDTPPGWEEEPGEELFYEDPLEGELPEPVSESLPSTEPLPIGVSSNPFSGTDPARWTEAVKGEIRRQFPEGLPIGRDMVILDETTRELTYFDQFHRMVTGADVPSRPMFYTWDGYKKEFVTGTFTLEIEGQTYQVEAILQDSGSGNLKLCDVLEVGDLGNPDFQEYQSFRQILGEDMPDGGYGGFLKVKKANGEAWQKLMENHYCTGAVNWLLEETPDLVSCVNPEDIPESFYGPETNLSQVRQEALYRYSHYNEGVRMNMVLGGAEGVEPTVEDWMNIDLTAQALDKMSLPQDTILYRGSSEHLLKGLEDLDRNDLDSWTGKELTMDGFASTSVLKTTSYNKPVQMVIVAKGGQKGAGYIDDISYNAANIGKKEDGHVLKREYEVLLQKSAKFVIIEAEQLWDKLILIVKWEGSNYGKE